MTARFSGKYSKGAMWTVRVCKRLEAQERSANVPCERTRAHRLSRRHVTPAQKRAGAKVCNCPAAPVESVATIS